jgi:hypothetical protein
MTNQIKVKIFGICNENPNGEMKIKYSIEQENREPEVYVEILESKFGNSIYKAEYKALNMALSRLLEMNLANAEIKLETVSSMILLHFLGYNKPRKGHYLNEAVNATKLMKRFFNLSIKKVNSYALSEIKIAS